VSEKPRIQSAARAIEILQAVAASGPAGISAKQLAEDLGLPRQVVYNLIHTLTAMQMVRKLSSSRYMLGLGIAGLAQGFRRQLSGSDVLAQLAERAAMQTGETSYVVGWIDEEIVVLASAHGSQAVHAAEVPVGSTGDAHARASGKLLLAMRSSEEVSRYLIRHPMSARTPHTLVDPPSLIRALQEIRKDWVSDDAEEYAIGLQCLAVPIGRPPTEWVLGLSAPSARLLQNREAYIATLRDIAAGLS
jgi:IclR family acetate operon transcriptional repressor